MLAPMQGLTNRTLRGFFNEWVRPDVVFTEFMHAHTVGNRPLSRSDLRDAVPDDSGVPLVVQVIGSNRESLVTAAQAAQATGARHLNLNLGCPYGRMTSGPTGGGMLNYPELLTEIIPALRQAISGSFSVKLRSGYDNPHQVVDLLPLFEDAGVDFLVLHPRTVAQEYTGLADHAVTAQVVRRTCLPVIANGDIRTAADGDRVLRETGAAGLMLGRGAIADPLLFLRLRGQAPAEPGQEEQEALLRHYLSEILIRYRKIFCGETQVLGKIKAILTTMESGDLRNIIKKMRKTKTLRGFISLIEELPLTPLRF